MLILETSEYSSLRLFQITCEILNLQAFEGENKVAKIKRTNIRLLGEYKFHNYVEEQQIRIKYLIVSA